MNSQCASKSVQQPPHDYISPFKMYSFILYGKVVIGVNVRDYIYIDRLAVWV